LTSSESPDDEDAEEDVDQDQEGVDGRVGHEVKTVLLDEPSLPTAFKN
jgi:hypothetical protein